MGLIVGSFFGGWLRLFIFCESVSLWVCEWSLWMCESVWVCECVCIDLHMDLYWNWYRNGPGAPEPFLYRFTYEFVLKLVQKWTWSSRALFGQICLWIGVEIDTEMMQVRVHVHALVHVPHALFMFQLVLVLFVDVISKSVPKQGLTQLFINVDINS